MLWGSAYQRSCELDFKFSPICHKSCWFLERRNYYYYVVEFMLLHIFCSFSKCISPLNVMVMQWFAWTFNSLLVTLHSVVHSSTHSFRRSVIHSFTRTFVHSFVHLHAHLFSQSVIRYILSWNICNTIRFVFAGEIADSEGSAGRKSCWMFEPWRSSGRWDVGLHNRWWNAVSLEVGFFYINLWTLVQWLMGIALYEVDRALEEHWWDVGACDELQWWCSEWLQHEAILAVLLLWTTVPLLWFCWLIQSTNWINLFCFFVWNA